MRNRTFVARSCGIAVDASGQRQLGILVASEAPALTGVALLTAAARSSANAYSTRGCNVVDSANALRRPEGADSTYSSPPQAPHDRG